MTPEQKGALLLAHHEGKGIQFSHACEWFTFTTQWHGWRGKLAYRVKPEPKRETVTMTGHNRGYWCFGSDRLEDRDTHRITFDTIDGEPDCATIRMDRLT
jgi:hypothetical protein